MPKFWMIYNPLGSTPCVKHYSHESVNNEISRLANRNPGVTFVLLEAVETHTYNPDPVKVVKL